MSCKCLNLQDACSNVREMSPEDKADLAAYPFDDAKELERLGAYEWTGEEGYGTLERR